MQPGDKFKLKSSVRANYKTIYYEILEIKSNIHIKCYAEGREWDCFVDDKIIKKDMEPVSDIRFNYFIKHRKELSEEF